MANNCMNPEKCRCFKVITDYRSAYIYYNDKKPWWKTKRPIFFIASNWWAIYESEALLPFDLTKMYIKFEESEELLPLIEHLAWWKD